MAWFVTDSLMVRHFRNCHYCYYLAVLSFQLHTRGLKLGIYTDIGYATCQKLPGTEFYMESDANTFAEWGVDLVKTDGCNADVKEMDVCKSDNSRMQAEEGI